MNKFGLGLEHVVRETRIYTRVLRNKMPVETETLRHCNRPHFICTPRQAGPRITVNNYHHHHHIHYHYHPQTVTFESIATQRSLSLPHTPLSHRLTPTVSCTVVVILLTVYGCIVLFILFLPLHSQSLTHPLPIIAQHKYTSTAFTLTSLTILQPPQPGHSFIHQPFNAMASP